MKRHIVVSWLWALAAGGPASAVTPQEVVFDFRGVVTGEDQLPTPWKILGHPTADTPTFSTEEDARLGTVMRLHAKGAQADAIYRAADVDLSKTPYINFTWKVVTHPAGQIGTRKSDQAINLNLDFGRLGFKKHVVSYTFDPKAKVGTWHDDSSFFAKNRALVLNSSENKLGEWISHSRNVAEDYRRCYKRTLPRLQNIAVFSDSHASVSEALAYCAQISFSERPVHQDSEKTR